MSAPNGSRDTLRVLVPVNLQEPTPDAVAVAVRLAGGPENVFVLSVVSPNDSGEAAMLWGENTTRQQHQMSLVRKWLDDHGWTGARCRVVLGEPAAQILEAAATLGASIIVIRSHGRTGLARLWLGSIAEEVAARSSSTVMILRNAPAFSQPDVEEAVSPRTLWS